MCNLALAVQFYSWFNKMLKPSFVLLLAFSSNSNSLHFLFSLQHVCILPQCIFNVKNKYLLQGGFQFNISLTEPLPDEVSKGVAHFEEVSATVEKLNPFTLSGIVPGKLHKKRTNYNKRSRGKGWTAALESSYLPMNS